MLKDSFKRDLRGIRGNCAMNGHLYTVGYGPEEEHVIHKLTADGVREASFAEVYSSANTSIQTMMSSDGLLACSEKNRIVGVIMDNIPALTAYTEHGVVVWRTRLADFKLRVMEEGIGQDGQTEIRQYGIPGLGKAFCIRCFRTAQTILIWVTTSRAARMIMQITYSG